jgi:sporulation protein YlmC with PRC-barrel domain
MNRSTKTLNATRLMRAATIAVMFGGGLAGPLLAAQPAGAPQSAQRCMNDLRVLDEQMQVAGNWVHGTGYGYGYPAYGYGYGDHRVATDHSNAGASGHSRARPGYEIRTMIAAATILAQRGDQKECDALVTATREMYRGYAADQRDRKAPRLDSAAWRRSEISSAVPVAISTKGYRFDQLIGADVVNPQGDDLGDVYDVVMSPETGNIAYLVVGRGGVFGIGERHIPVPWEAFKASPDNNVMVLDSTKSNMDAAPVVAVNHFSPAGNVGQQGKDADAFWKTRLLK